MAEPGTLLLRKILVLSPMKSLTDTTLRSDLLMIHSETKAPTLPLARAMPRAEGISWFISRVKVPSPLSNAPRPSGMPTIRYGVTPSGLLFTLSPTVMIEVSSTPAAVGTMYGEALLDGPVTTEGTQRDSSASTCGRKILERDMVF